MKTTLYVATSLDGYIAGPEGELDWLAFDGGEDFGFHAFLSSVDGVVMGSGTFQVIQKHGKWPYGDTPGWVFTRRPLEGLEGAPVHFVQGDVVPVLEGIAGSGVEHLWLVGGGDLLLQFQDAGRADEYRIFVIPILLGAGIRLFPDPKNEASRRKLILREARPFENGVVELRYTL